MIARARQFLRIPPWARVAISIALLALVLSRVDLPVVGSALADANLLIVGFLLCSVYGERIYAALRWHQVLKWSRAQVPLPVVIRLSFIAAFAGLFLPGAVGAEAIRVVGLARYSADLAMAFSSVLVERMIAVLTLAPLVLIGLAFAPAEMPPGIRITAWAALAAVFGLAFTLLHSFPRRIIELLLPRRISAVVLPRLESLYLALNAYTVRPGMFAFALLLGLGFQVLRVVVVWLSALAVGIDVPLAYHFMFAPIIALVSMAPISFAGIGVREAAYVYLFSLVAVPAERALAASVLVQFTGLLSCLPGAILYARGGRLRQIARGERACVRL
jgi:glycosyltransferase 2 family protein